VVLQNGARKSFSGSFDQPFTIASRQPARPQPAVQAVDQPSVQAKR
jgi:hypothetical protein